MWFIFVRRKVLNSWLFQVLINKLYTAWIQQLHHSACPCYSKHGHFLLQKFRRIPSPMSLTLIKEINFWWPCLSVIFQILSCFYLTMGCQLSENRQKWNNHMSQQKYEALKITISSVITLHVVVFASTKSYSYTFIQIFLLGL